MPKPYSILAAAFVSRGRSLASPTAAAKVDRRDALPREESREQSANHGELSLFDFDSPFATDPLADCAPTNAAALSA